MTDPIKVSDLKAEFSRNNELEYDPQGTSLRDLFLRSLDTPGANRTLNGLASGANDGRITAAEIQQLDIMDIIDETAGKDNKVSLAEVKAQVDDMLLLYEGVVSDPVARAAFKAIETDLNRL